MVLGGDNSVGCGHGQWSVYEGCGGIIDGIGWR